MLYNLYKALYMLYKVYTVLYMLYKKYNQIYILYNLYTALYTLYKVYTALYTRFVLWVCKCIIRHIIEMIVQSHLLTDVVDVASWSLSSTFSLKIPIALRKIGLIIPWHSQKSPKILIVLNILYTIIMLFHMYRKIACIFPLHFPNTPKIEI
jgi:hypothetical protein